MKHALLLLAVLTVAPTPSCAQTIEDAEAELKAARLAEQRERDQQAARDAAISQAAQATREAKAARDALAQANAQSTLILQSDADCNLIIDGKAQGELITNRPQSMQVQAGELIIQCTSTLDPNIAVEMIKAAPGGGKQIIRVDLAALLQSNTLSGEAGTVFRDKLKSGGDGPEMVVVAAGSFMMGSNLYDPGSSLRETPKHRVMLGEFSIGRTEVSVAEFRKFVQVSGYRTDAENNEGRAEGCQIIKRDEPKFVADTSWKSPGFAQGETHPAVCLSANDALAYSAWLSAETGKLYGLPSEAQQEYTIRAGSDLRFPWGDDPNAACLHANVRDESAAQTYPGGIKCTDGYLYSSPVATFRANAFGLHDAVGNAWEWSADCWNEDHANAPPDGSPRTSGDCDLRVLRGGGLFNTSDSLRSAVRISSSRVYRSFYTGFRVVQLNNSGKGTLILSSDSDCNLRIDGTSYGELTANQPRLLQVVAGEQLIHCASIEDPAKSVEVIKLLEKGTKVAVKLDFARPSDNKPGAAFSDHLKDGTEGPTMVVIPGGSLVMSPADWRNLEVESPHRVTLKSFAMGKTEVTVAQFRKFVDATGYTTDAERNAHGETGCFFRGASTPVESWKSPGFLQEESHPVVCVSTNDAEAYITWLSNETEAAYHLPSEAHQEYSIRAGSGSRFPWGDNVDSACLYSNVGTLDGAKCSDEYRYTAPVGSFRSNPFRIDDTIGNAMEWSADCYDPDYSGAPTDGAARLISGCSFRVVRGWAWSHSHSQLTSRHRMMAQVNSRSSDLGFRLMREL